jgi:hypothetical protein
LQETFPSIPSTTRHSATGRRTSGPNREEKKNETEPFFFVFDVSAHTRSINTKEKKQQLDEIPSVSSYNNSYALFPSPRPVTPPWARSLLVLATKRQGHMPRKNKGVCPADNGHCAVFANQKKGSFTSSSHPFDVVRCHVAGRK